MTSEKIEAKSFRDSIGTMDDEGKRKWIYPKKPKGYFTKARNWVSIFLLALLFSAPFIRIGGEPLVLFNLIERKFIIFGRIFWPQDFHLFGLAMLILVIFISLFTVVYGRIFCGWVCPQTIFMEGVFRKIEYWIEGDWKQQMKLDKSPWNREKAGKKISKHIIFYLVSFIIANTFLAYIIGSEALIEIITDPFGAHIGGLISTIIFSAVFYGVFAKFREQVCTNVCPYGRLQGVLLDKQSVVVAYDYGRGESRGKFRKKESRLEVGKGDCIDCNQCVNVCPTGIDIRNGTQLECINCTACMDACDEMMDAVDLKKGLIRYTSEEQIQTGDAFVFSTRAKAFSVVLVLLIGIMSALLFSRTEIETTILRTPGMRYQTNDNGSISNLYNYKLINKSNKDLIFHFIPVDSKIELKLVGHEPALIKQEVVEGAFFISAPLEYFKAGKAKTDLEIQDDEGRVIESVEISIMGPL